VPDVVVLDYGAGNVRSVVRAFERAGAKATVSADPDRVARAERLVFPGQGALPDCMQRLGAQGLDDAVRAHIASGRPYLGICLGLQALFERGSEHGGSEGLGVLRGEVVRFPEDLAGADGRRLKVPHMGWNEIQRHGDNPLLAGIPAGATFYFCHSYYAAPATPEVVAATCHYGIDYCWGGYRMKQQAYRMFGPGDQRAAFFWTAGQQDSVADIGNFSDGIAAPKFTNMTSTGGTGAQLSMVDTDFPIFRLAEAYLIYAEAAVRTGNDLGTALNYVNLVRERAFGGTSGDITAAQLTLPFILNERSRELLFEARRRTDLIRFGEFTGGTYLWAWKGGVAGGQSIADKYDLYPLPSDEIIANPNLTQNPGY